MNPSSSAIHSLQIDSLQTVFRRRLRSMTWTALAMLGIAGAGTLVVDGQDAAIPFPIPVYEIEAVSGGHTAHLPGLPIAPVGTLQTPIPVDVDGDLLPDITVAVNLVNAEGLLNNPPQIGEVIAPNIEITRLETAPLLAQISPPLRVNVKFTVVDLEGQEPDTIVRFGYETGEGGSIPMEFKALVGGLDNFFNPIEAVIDTTGGPVNLDPGVDDFGLGPASSSYEGPLSVIAGLETGDIDADIDLRYKPFPDAVRVTFGWDDTGQHITYAHDVLDEVDLVTDIDFTSGDSTTDLVAAIDRMPRAMAIDILQSGDEGALDFQARADERLPDLRADLRQFTPGQPPLNAAVDIEDLPREMHAGWNTATPSATFRGSGNGIGAIEARVTNFDGDPLAVEDWIAGEQQYVNLEMAPGGAVGDEFLAGARLERIREVTFQQADDGLQATIETGDGQLPLQAHGNIDLRGQGLPKIVGTVNIAPLPDLIDVSMIPGVNDDQPLTVTYDASSPVDIDTSIKMTDDTAIADAVCGDAGTICADFDARHIPSHLQARIIEVNELENRIEVDADGDPGAAKPDFDADVIIGQEDGHPLVAHAAIEQLARDLRIRTLQGADETLERFEFHTCDRVYDADPFLDECTAGTEDEIGLLEFSIANFVERPSNLPPPAATAPNHATVTGRGIVEDAANVVLFEATGRIESIEKVQYVNAADIFGVSTTIGDDQDLEIDVDLADIKFQGLTDDTGAATIDSNAVISPLPDDITFCFANAGRVPGGPTDPITAECEGLDPFGDGPGNEPAEGPMVAAYRANTPFDVDFDATVHFEGQDEGSVADDQDIEAELDILNVPSDLTAIVQPAADAQPMRGLVLAPADPGERLDVDLRGAYTTGGTDCDDPNPTSLGDIIVACVDVEIDDLPTSVSFLANATDPENTQVLAYTCDYDALDLIPGECRDTQTEIGAVAINARIFLDQLEDVGAIHPRGVAHYAPTEDQHFIAGADVVDGQNLEIRAAARLEEIRSIVFQQTADGFEAATDLGTGVKPLEIHAAADLRNAVEDEGYRLLGDVLIDPLPRTLSFTQDGPGADQTVEPMRITFETNEADSIGDVVDVDASFLMKEPPASADDLCGAANTACASVDLNRLPRVIDVAISETEADVVAGESTSELLAVVETTQHAVQTGPADKTDLALDATLGPDTFGLNTGTPLIDGKPLVAHLELNKLPTILHARMTDRTFDDGTTTSTQLETMDVHTCAPDDPGLAIDGTCDGGDELGEIVLGVRNFLLRPTDFPPPDPETPLYITLTGRDELFETAAYFNSIRDIAYANYGDEMGAALGIGDNSDFSITADIKGFELDTLELGDLDLEPAVIDADLSAIIRDLPTTASFCMRNGGIDMSEAATRGGMLTPCENADPFGDGGPLSHTPLSVAYRASNDIDVETDVKLVVGGNDAGGGGAVTPRTISGVLDILDIPAEITTHFLMPEDDGDGPDGPMRLLYDTSSTNSEQMDIHFEGLMAVGDSVCEDPRPTADSICAQGDINNIPSRVEVFLDPTVTEDNFFIRTPESDQDLEFVNLLLASVKPTDDPTKADVMVITADIEGIPHAFEGSLHFPADAEDAPSVRVYSPDDAIDRIAGTFRNFIAPDPTPAAPPAQRAGLPAADQEFVVFQRGDALRATVEITDLKGGGMQTLRTAGGEALPTSVFNVDFGQDTHVRAYADLIPDSTTRTIGDVTLESLPAGIEVCFRGVEDPGTDPATVVNHCDTADPESGAFEFRGTSSDPNPFSIHAFIRQATAGGTDVISGDLSIIGIPPVLKGTFPADGEGALDVGGYALDGTTVDGIDEIRFNIATFDVDSHGYGSDIPFQANTLGSDPFPAPTSANQYLSAVTDLADAQIRGRLGLASDASSSRFQRVRMLPEACDRPEYNPPDYPFFPASDDDTSYTCIRVDLEQTSVDPDPMDLHVEVKLEDDNRIRLRDAGLTNLPPYFQMTLAEAPTQNPDGSLRRRCGTFSTAVNTGTGTWGDFAETAGTTDCMPPLVRVDQPSLIRLFGTLEYGNGSDLATIGNVDPRETLADLDAAPTPAGWSDWGADPLGIRFKVAEFGSGDNATTAARANLRLPIPNSIQVDQIQSWSESSRDGKAEYWDASDFRFHFVSRTIDGSPIVSLGQLTGMYQTGDGTQVLLSKPFYDYDPPSANNNTTIDPDNPNFSNAVGSPAEPNPIGYPQGIEIPGEVGLDMYTRNHRGNGENFIQIDGILSTEMDIGLRALGGSGSALGRAEAQIVDLPGREASDGLEDPSFRFRLNTLGAGAEPPTGSQPEEPEEEDDGSECTWYFCARTEIKFKDVFLNIDFDPTDDGTPVRRVDAVVNTRDGKQGVEVAGYEQPDPDGSNKGAPEGITVQASIDINPINVFVHAGIPLIGGADFILLSDLQAGFGIENVNNLQLRHNLLHMKVRSQGGQTTIGPFHYNIHLMHGSAYLLFVKLFGVDFIPPSPPPYLIGFVGCDGLSSWGLWSLSVGNNGMTEGQSQTKDFVIAINNDPRLIFSGLIGSPLNLLKAFIAPFFCLTDVSTGSIPLIDSEHPGDPVGVARVTGHPVPGAPEAADPPIGDPPVDPVGPSDFTATSNISLCGAQAFGDLTINGGATVSVANSADATEVAPPDVNGQPIGAGQRCPAGDEGTLQITADTVTINGVLQADNLYNGDFSTTPTGNSGGGHGGAGGDGSSGSGAGGYGSVDPTNENVDLTEPGGHGHGNGRRYGGGTIIVNATDIVIGGTISANGGDAVNQGTGHCDVWGDHDNDANTPDVVVSANNGVSGGGGGAGGGIVLIGVEVQNNGTIRANGGDGADGRKGGGGGGGGGIVEIISPLLSGNDPVTSGGARGVNTCDGDASPFGDGSNGNAGQWDSIHGPQSKAHAPDRFWYTGSFDLPFEAAAYNGNDDEYDVIVCQMYASVADLDGAGSLSALFDVPDSNNGNNPCGSGATAVASVAQNVERVQYDPPGTVSTIPISVSGGSGYYGYYTVAQRHNWFDCNFWILFNGDTEQCETEYLPDQVDVVVGIDKDEPDLLISQPPNNAELNSHRITLDLTVNDQAGLSGVDRVQCSHNGTAWYSCAEGSQEWDLLSGDGAKQVWARAYDLAGNVSHDSGDEPFVDLVVDSTAPTGTMATLGGSQSGGWFHSRPQIRFSSWSDGSGLGEGSDPWVYKFDGGSEHICATVATCDSGLTDINNLTLGAHEVTGVVRDRLGNERTLTPIAFNIDDEAPLTALRTVPADADSLGWFTTQPWVVLSAIDQVGASGVDTIRYTLNGGGSQTYTAPFQLGPGIWDVCFWATDNASNTASSDCVNDIQVDDAAPGGSINIPAPTGANGWYDAVPSVTFSGFSDDQGAQPAAGEFRYRVDNSAYADCDNPCAVDPAHLQTGVHRLHFTTIDRLGNQRDHESSYTLKVDTQVPTTEIVVTPAIPGRGVNGWHWEQPWILLDAVDQVGASGIAATTYTDNAGPPIAYSGPFQLADGVHDLCVTSTDVAGNEEEEHCATISVDTVDPSTVASAPAPTGGDGWHDAPITVTVASGDATSTVNPTFDPSTADLCDAGRPDENPKAPSGTCISIDGGPFVVWDEALDLDLDDGVHHLRTYSVDVSGRRSVMEDEIYRIDSTAPVTHVRLVPAEGNDLGWYRRFPTMVLRADDGDPNATSSVDLIQYRIDGGAWEDYTKPVLLQDGLLDVDTRVVDVADNVRIDPDAGDFKIDVHPPVTVPRDPSPLIWVHVGGDTIQLRWRVTEDLSEKVKVGVIVHDETGNVVRRLDGGSHTVTPGSAYNSYTEWDGMGETLTDLVPAGIYYYRVVAIDEAGNMAHSRESRPFTLEIGGGLLCWLLC